MNINANSIGSITKDLSSAPIGDGFPTDEFFKKVIETFKVL